MRRALLVATAGLVFAGAGFAATLAAVHLTASVPAPALALRVPASFTIASGTPPVITVPPQGSLALDADPRGRLAEQGPGPVPPIASVAQAIALGMRQTHFADPSGFDPATVSTAADLVRLGRAVLAVPALADIVATRQATLPDGTQLRNLDTLLDTEPGWLGIKTGDSDAAGGCLLFAARRPPSGSSGPPVEVVGAVLGQPDRA